MENEAAGPPGTPPGRRLISRSRLALCAALALCALAVLQHLLVLAGFGDLLPGGQPWPLLLGAALAWPVLRRRFSGNGPPPLPGPVRRVLRAVRRVPVALWLLGALALAAGVWAWLQDKEPWIGHEEAVYANKARSWYDGTPDAGWGPYRPLGLPALGRIALEIHPGVGALRAVALVLTLGALLTVHLVAARWLASPRRAVVVVLVLLSGVGFLRRVPEFLTDIGVTALLLWLLLLLVRAQENPAGRALDAVPLVTLAAFYLRYGVVGNLLAITVAALLCYGPRSWLRHSRRLARAGAVLLVGLLPHLVHATVVTGSPVGLLTWATHQAERGFVGDGFLYYLAIFPYRLAGDLGAIVMAAGAVAAFRAARRLWRAHRGAAPPVPVAAEDRRTAFLGCCALLIPLVLGVATDGEPRFVYVPVVLLTILGVGRLADLAGSLVPALLAAVAAMAVLTVLGTARVIADVAMAAPNAQRKSTVPVALELRNDGRPCLLVTGYEPDLGWYSGCDAVTYGQFRRMSPPPGTLVRLVLFEKGRDQPGAAALERLIGDRHGGSRTVPTEGSLGDATVITLTP
ncbi:glycosyltransferase [Streptomyces clavuligerus]|uniref:glycosyltransferase n=1 Tax=Streptomyces clavuligerus TaxID=1901 RepID=UPI000313A5C7|nr:glycosyltransferase [Streptomyces clavuligerus]